MARRLSSAKSWRLVARLAMASGPDAARTHKDSRDLVWSRSPPFRPHLMGEPSSGTCGCAPSDVAEALYGGKLGRQHNKLGLLRVSGCAHVVQRSCVEVGSDLLPSAGEAR